METSGLRRPETVTTPAFREGLAEAKGNTEPKQFGCQTVALTPPHFVGGVFVSAFSP